MWSCRRSMATYSGLTTALSVVILYLCYCKVAHSALLSCGNVQNVMCPFYLGGYEHNCNSFSYELFCKDNRTVLELRGISFFVEDINYDEFSFLVVDPGIKKNDYSSLPLYSVEEDPYIIPNKRLKELNVPITFINCQAPANSRQYMNITSIISSTSAYKYSYVTGGRMMLSQVEENCQVTKMAWVSLTWPLLKNVPLSTSWFTSNFSELHDGMAYGFKIDWSRIVCRTCSSFDRKAYCKVTGSRPSCFYNCDFFGTDTSLPTCKYN